MQRKRYLAYRNILWMYQSFIFYVKNRTKVICQKLYKTLLKENKRIRINKKRMSSIFNRRI